MTDTARDEAGEKGSQPLLQIARQVEQLPTLFFPDEYEKPRPFVRNVADELSVGVAEAAPLTMPSGKGYRAKVLLGTDGDTRSWQIPYLGRHQQTGADTMIPT